MRDFSFRRRQRDKGKLAPVEEGDRKRLLTLVNNFEIKNIKGTGHFFETLSVGSVPGTDHS